MLEIKNINYEINGKKILNDVSFKLFSGKFNVLLGPNGAGKSTLLKLISREIKTQQGTILLNDKNIFTYDVQQMSIQRAVMTQNISLSSNLHSEEVVLMGRYPHFDNSPQENDFVSVEKTMHKTETIEFKKRNYHSLSGGEQQRIQFSRVMTQVYENNETPKLLLLDEPLNNLDIKHQHKILDLAKEFSANGNIVLAVLHDINLSALYADEIILLKNGEKKYAGKPREVLTSENISFCYDFPARVEIHPFHHCPVVYFGCPVENKPTLKPQYHDTKIQS